MSKCLPKRCVCALLDCSLCSLHLLLYDDILLCHVGKRRGEVLRFTSWLTYLTNSTPPRYGLVHASTIHSHCALVALAPVYFRCVWSAQCSTFAASSQVGPTHRIIHIKYHSCCLPRFSLLAGLFRIRCTLLSGGLPWQPHHDVFVRIGGRRPPRKT